MTRRPATWLAYLSHKRRPCTTWVCGTTTLAKRLRLMLLVTWDTEQQALHVTSIYVILVFSSFGKIVENL
jgi:hypothetical protein